MNDKIYFWNTKLGKAATVGRPLTRKEREYILYFLGTLRGDDLQSNQIGVDSMSKTESKRTSKKSEASPVNQVWLAGTIKMIRVSEEEGRAFFLLDTDQKKWIPCTVYEDAQLLSVLSGFEADDFIRLRGYVRPWSEKKDGEWKNNIDIRVTEIKNTSGPPAKPKAVPKRKQSAAVADDADDFITF